MAMFGLMYVTFKDLQAASPRYSEASRKGCLNSIRLEIDLSQTVFAAEAGGKQGESVGGKLLGSSRPPN